MGTWEGNGPRLGASIGTHALMHRVCIPMHDNGSLMRLHGLGLSKAPPLAPGTRSHWRGYMSAAFIQYMTGSQLISDSGIKRPADSENRRTPPPKRTYLHLGSIVRRHLAQSQRANGGPLHGLREWYGVTGYVNVQTWYVCNAQISLPVQAMIVRPSLGMVSVCM